MSSIKNEDSMDQDNSHTHKNFIKNKFNNIENKFDEPT